MESAHVCDRVTHPGASGRHLSDVTNTPPPPPPPRTSATQAFPPSLPPGSGSLSPQGLGLIPIVPPFPRGLHPAGSLPEPPKVLAPRQHFLRPSGLTSRLANRGSLTAHYVANSTDDTGGRGLERPICVGQSRSERSMDYFYCRPKPQRMVIANQEKKHVLG